MLVERILVCFYFKTLHALQRRYVLIKFLGKRHWPLQASTRANQSLHQNIHELYDRSTKASEILTAAL